MAADITTLFKSTIKALQKTKSASKSPADDNETSQKAILDDVGFRDTSQSILKTIIELRHFLREKNSEFTNISSGNNRTNDRQFENIDKEVESTLLLCQKGLKRIRIEHLDSKYSDQVRQHRQTVVELLQKYLKNVTKLYKDQVAVRRKRVVIQKQIAGRSLDDGVRQRVLARSSGDRKAPAKASTLDDTAPRGSRSPVPSDGGDFSSQEVQLFEQENDTLFDELNGMLNEVKSLESKITDISRLQEMFTEHVLSQEKNIDHIAQTTVNATENVKGGNEQLREAMKNQSTLRFWVLFFVIVCTLTLIFLDWYNA